jgi:hypothetical protein
VQGGDPTGSLATLTGDGGSLGNTPGAAIEHDENEQLPDFQARAVELFLTATNRELGMRSPLVKSCGPQDDHFWVRALLASGLVHAGHEPDGTWRCYLSEVAVGLAQPLLCENDRGQTAKFKKIFELLDDFASRQSDGSCAGSTAETERERDKSSPNELVFAVEHTYVNARTVAERDYPGDWAALSLEERRDQVGRAEPTRKIKLSSKLLMRHECFSKENRAMGCIDNKGLKTMAEWKQSSDAVHSALAQCLEINGISLEIAEKHATASVIAYDSDAIGRDPNRSTTTQAGKGAHRDSCRGCATLTVSFAAPDESSSSTLRFTPLQETCRKFGVQPPSTALRKATSGCGCLLFNVANMLHQHEAKVSNASGTEYTIVFFFKSV